MPYANPQSLVSTEWLAEHLGRPKLVVVDATYVGSKPCAGCHSGHVESFGLDDPWLGALIEGDKDRSQRRF